MTELNRTTCVYNFVTDYFAKIRSDFTYKFVSTKNAPKENSIFANIMRKQKSLQRLRNRPSISIASYAIKRTRKIPEQPVTV